MAFFRRLDGVGSGGTQKRWVDVPLLSLVGGDAGRLLIEPDDDAGLSLAGVALEAHTVAHAEMSQHGRAAGLANELESLDDQAIEETEVLFVHAPDRLGRSRPIRQFQRFTRHIANPPGLSQFPRGSFPTTRFSSSLTIGPWSKIEYARCDPDLEEPAKGVERQVPRPIVLVEIPCRQFRDKQLFVVLP